MATIYNLCVNICTVFSNFVPKIVEIFTRPLVDLYENFPTPLRIIIAPGLEVLDLLGIDQLTLLEACFGAGVTVWIVWGIIKFFLPTT